MAIAYRVVRFTLNLKMYGPNAPAATSVIPFHSRWASGPDTREDATPDPVTGSQIRTVWSSLAVASQLPSGAIATARTLSVWPVRVWRWVPVAGSQIRTVRSSLAVASQAAVRGDRHRPHAAGVAGEGVALGAGGRIPDPHRAVAAGGGQPAAVRGDRHRPHVAGVAGEGVALGAGGRIPDPDRAVVAAGGQPGAVRGDRHRPHGAGVAGEGVALGAGGRIPDPDRAVVSRRWPARCRPGRSPPPAPCRCGR